MDNSNNIEPHKLSIKELKDQELITLHRNVLVDYIMTNLQWTLKKRQQALKLYDDTIDRSNIRHYYNRHVGIFLIALLQDKLESIANYAICQDDDDDEDDED